MLYKVWRNSGGVFKMGEVYRLLDDGFEKCITRTVNGRMEITGYTGLILPYDAVAPYVIAMHKNGFDYRALAERQKGN
jgi:hypothetical protein